MKKIYKNLLLLTKDSSKFLYELSYLKLCPFEGLLKKCIMFKMESFFVQIDATVNSINNQIISARVKCEPKLNNILISYKETLTKVLDF